MTSTSKWNYLALQRFLLIQKTISNFIFSHHIGQISSYCSFCAKISKKIIDSLFSKRYVVKGISMCACTHRERERYAQRVNLLINLTTCTFFHGYWPTLHSVFISYFQQICSQIYHLSYLTKDIRSTSWKKPPNRESWITTPFPQWRKK